MASNPSAFVATPASIGAAPAAAVAWQPSDNGMLIASDDLLACVSASTAITAGTLYLVKVTARAATLITNLNFGLSTAGSGASTGSFAGLYSSAGVLLSGSADCAAQFTGAAGAFAVPLTTPQTLAAGSFGWVAILSNLATTQPALVRAGGGGAGVPGLTNVGLTAATFRFAVNGTGITSLPGSVTPASNTSPASLPFWAGGS
jgi:hypothetical protein